VTAPALDGAKPCKGVRAGLFDSPSGPFLERAFDPTHIFFDNSPEDVNTWSYLAMQDPKLRSVTRLGENESPHHRYIFAFNNGWGHFGTLKLRVTGMTFASLSKLGTVLGDQSRGCGRSLVGRHWAT